jgi:hypothetical protein
MASANHVAVHFLKLHVVMGGYNRGAFEILAMPAEFNFTG